MGIFKKNEVYDYTLLQKKGFLKIPESKKSSGKVTKDGYFELGVEDLASVPPAAVSAAAETASLSEGSPLNFFDSFSANAAQSSESSANPLASFDSFGSSSSGGVVPGPDFQDLSVKLEDFEFKLARIADKLAMIEAKLEEFEERVK